LRDDLALQMVEAVLAAEHSIPLRNERVRLLIRTKVEALQIDHGARRTTARNARRVAIGALLVASDVRTGAVTLKEIAHCSLDELAGRCALLEWPPLERALLNSVRRVAGRYFASGSNLTLGTHV